MPDQLSEYEIILLRDFLKRRPRRFALINACIGFVACIVMLFMRSPEWPLLVVGTLGGLLIGIYFEQRHVAHLRRILAKLSIHYISGDAPE